MRITNSIISNNMLLNLNRNMTKLNKLENQLATGKKIQFPSDNPIIAGKGLKLRTNLYENEQYQKNISDATAWMNMTEKAIDNISGLTSKIRELCVQGASSTLSKSDREKILEEIKQLREQLVQESNASNAGRYILGGYKTDEKIMFDAPVTKTVQLSDKFKAAEMKNVIENDNFVYKLPYGNVENVELTIDGETYDTIGSAGCIVIEKSSTDADAYTPPIPGAVKTVHLIKETGELVFDKTHQSSITDPIEVKYEKTRFEAGDLNPVHYFDTIETVTIGGSVGSLNSSNKVQLNQQNILQDSINSMTIGGISPTQIIYTDSSDTSVSLGPLEVRVDKDSGLITAGSGFASGDNVEIDYFKVVNDVDYEKIEYEVSVNTKMMVNTLGKNVITIDMIKDIDTLINDVTRLDSEHLSKVFGKAMSNIDTHNKNILKNQAGVGSKMNRLELIRSRLENDNINYVQLVSDNEDADMADTITQLKTQSTIYQASLAAGAQIIQKSLVDFIN